MDYQFKEIERKWQAHWAAKQTFKVSNQSSKPKFYVLDMFPYPSGAGLHVGHPLGYIASDIFARYKRLKGFNVLHPMGYDSFGLPAEQYAIQTGQHPAITTEANINRYREQLDNIGFSFDWSREVRTSDPGYYKWTQWIFMQLFNSWYNLETDQAEPIQTLIAKIQNNGSSSVKAVCDEEISEIAAGEWNKLSEEEQQRELLKYRLTYLRESTVNWCPALGTVLANDEVKDGFSERGGYPVEQKKMMQWSMRITAYAERLLQGLDTIDWPEPLKEMQRNWIGKSIGASVLFPLENTSDLRPQTSGFIEVFTTRVDTIFGVTFLVIAPEHELVAELTTPEQKKDIENYITQTKKKSELDRMADTKTVSGAFTGSYAINPLDGQKVPVWIADYVLAGYGTGAVMAVPSGDQRDYLFAKHFNLPIIQILDSQQIETEADPIKEGRYINSGLINGMTYQEAIPALNAKLEELGAGKAKVNFRMRDAIFGRQRYWGEPVPVYFKGDLPYLIDESELPLVLPEVDKYLPTESGEPPLGRAENWSYKASPQPSPEEREHGSYRQQADPVYYDHLKENSRQNRKQPTEAENILWQHLRNSTTGFKFRRQHAIDRFIADFVCLKKGLIVEVDGNHHFNIAEEDQLRTDILSDYGFEVIRFSNQEIISNPGKVVAVIKKKLLLMQDRKVSPSGGGLEGAEYEYELSTMPGWAGSSWYWFRYMDAQNSGAFADKQAIEYWKDVDLYIGGSEHATGHLLYSRFWNKFLKDLGYVTEEEPFKKLINQGMIQGRSNFMNKLFFKLVDDNKTTHSNKEILSPDELVIVYLSNDLIKERDNKGVREKYIEKIKAVELETHLNSLLSAELNKLGLRISLSQATFTGFHVDVNFINNDILDINKFKGTYSKYRSEFICNTSGDFLCSWEIEKMSKSKFNVVNPDDLIERYGADTLRMYEMFLGPLEQSKPWNTNGIEGVFKFLRKFWKLFHDDSFNFKVSDEAPTKAELKSLHKIILKVQEDVERFSFNTSVSSFMICVNELTDLKCNKSAILQDLVLVLSPYAPHICEELWTLLGNEAGTISYATYPKYNAEYMIESEFAYPVSVNGKTRMNLNISLSLEATDVENLVLANEDLQKYLEGKTPKKVIFVKGKIINIVI